MLAGRGDGIDLDTPSHWATDDVKDADRFFELLPIIFPFGGNLYFEGSQVEPEVIRFYEANRAQDAVSVIRDMIFPTPEMYHVKFNGETQSALRQFVKTLPLERLFFHVKGYRDGRLYFTFHDAFAGSLLISQLVPDEAVKEFSQQMKAPFTLEETKVRDTQGLKAFQDLLENPHKLRIAGEPWWRRWGRRLGF